MSLAEKEKHRTTDLEGRGLDNRDDRPGRLRSPAALSAGGAVPDDDPGVIELPAPINPNGERGHLGCVVACEVLRLGATDVEAEAPMGGIAVDLRVTESPVCAFTRVGTGLALVATDDEKIPVVATLFVAPVLLPPPMLDDATKERLAQALADVILAEVTP